MPDEQYDVAVNVAANDQASGALGGIAGTAEDTSAAINSASNAALGMGAATAGAMVPAVNEFADFESTMTEVQVQSGATEKQMKAMRKAAKAKEMEHYGKSATEVAKAYRRLAATGKSVKQMRQMMHPIMQTSVALHQDEARTTKSMLQMMEQYRLDASDMGRVADALAGSLQNTSFQSDEVTSALDQLGPVASTANMSLEETIAIAASVDDQVGNASRSGRMLKGVIQKIRGPTKRFKDELKKSSVTLGQLQGALDDPVRLTQLLTKLQKSSANTAQMFGRETITAVAALRGKAEAIRKDIKALQKQGMAQKAAERAANTTRGQWERLRAMYSNVALQIGQALKPVLEALAPVIEDIAGTIQYILNTGWGKWLVKMAAYSAGASMALGGMGKVLAGIIGIGGKAVGAIQTVSTVLGGGGLSGIAETASGLLGSGGLAGSLSSVATTITGSVGPALASMGSMLVATGPYLIAAAAIAGLAYELWKLYEAYQATTEAGKEMKRNLQETKEMQKEAAEAGYLDPEEVERQQREAAAAAPTWGERAAGWFTGGGVTGQDLAESRALAGMPAAMKDTKEANEDLAGASREASDELAGHSLTTASAEASTSLQKLGSIASVGAAKVEQLLNQIGRSDLFYANDGDSVAAKWGMAGIGRALSVPGRRAFNRGMTGGRQTIRHEVRVRGDGAAGDSGLLRQLVQSMMQDPEMRKRIEALMGDILRTGYASRQPA